MLSCEQMALPNHRAEPEVATSLRSFLSVGVRKEGKGRGKKPRFGARERTLVASEVEQ